MNFKVLWLFAKVFSAKFGGMAFFSGASEQPTKVLLMKIFFPPTHERFFPTKVSRYTVFRLKKYNICMHSIQQ